MNKKNKQPDGERLYCGVPKKFIQFKSIRNNSNKKSEAYKYFLIFEHNRTGKSIMETHLHCKECFKNWQPNSVPKIQKYLVGSSTGNMFSHLQRDHDIFAKDGENNLKLTSFFKPTNNSVIDTDFLFLIWIALDNLPLSKVNGRGFEFLMSRVAKALKVPTREVVTRKCLPAIYGAFKKHIYHLIATEIKFYTLAIDIWTNDFQKLPYLASVLHYGCDSTQREILLEMSPFLGPHTGIAISMQIKRVVKEFKLDPTRLRVVGDSASNNILATTILKCDWQPCIAHRINTVVTTSLDIHTPTMEVLKKCRKIYKFLLFKKQDLDEAAEFESNETDFAGIEATEMEAAEIEANEIIENVSAHFEIQTYNKAASTTKAKRIKIDVQTRWNSTYLMLQSMIGLEPRILHVLLKFQKRALAFDDKDLALMKKLLIILKPFYDATMTASKSSGEGVAIRLVFEILNTLDHLETLTATEKNNQILMLLIGLKTNLIDKVTITGEMYLSVLLDPFLKDAVIFKKRLSRLSIDPFELIQRYLQKFGICDSVPVQVPVSYTQQETWRAKIRKVETISEDVDQSIKRYLATIFSDDTSTKSFWKANPGCLSKLFEIVNSMPFSSVSVERTFSCAGNVLTGNRNSLNPFNVKKLMFINRNFDICEETISQITIDEDLQ